MATLVMFGMIKEGMLEFMEDHLGAFPTELAADQFGPRALTFREFRACGALEFFGKKGPNISRRWVVDI